MYPIEVAAHLGRLVDLVNDRVVKERDPNGPWHKTQEAYRLLWTCWEDCAIGEDSTWEPPQPKKV